VTFIVAVAGKGGVGKTTISALIVRALAERSRDVVLAIDADPNSNLGERLGVKVERTIGGLREDLLKNAEDLPPGSKHEAVRYALELAKTEGNDFDLLTMGRSEGPGCYCYINNVLRTFIDEAIDRYPYAVIDNEAGMEHLSRRTTKRMDVLIVVSDATKVGLDTAARIFVLAEEMELKVVRRILVVNRAPMPTASNVMEMAKGLGIEGTLFFPEDKEVFDLAVTGEPLSSLGDRSILFSMVREMSDSFR
jgi:CO dehydrogenase maturation factor